MKKIIFLLILGLNIINVNSQTAGTIISVDRIDTTGLTVITDSRQVNIGNDTNTVYVSGAGTAAANGTYSFKNANVPSAGFIIYTNANGLGGGVIRDPNLDFSDNWALTNISNVELYGSVSGPSTTWFKSAGGANPVPTVNYGTNFATSNLTYTITTYPLPLPVVQTNVLYVAPIDNTNGSDIYGLRGRFDRPFATLTYAITNQATNGDLIYLMNGYHEFSNYPTHYQLPNNLTVIGSGRKSTFVHGKDSTPSSTTTLYTGNSNYIANFSGTNILIYGGDIVNKTNSTIENLDLYALGDVIVAQGSTYGLDIINCRLDGNSDKFADLSGALAGNASDYQTNFFLRMINCELYGGAGQDGDGLNVLQGKLRKEIQNLRTINGTIINSVSNNTTANVGIAVKSPQTIRTNFISGQFYTNTYPKDINVSATITNVEAAVAGTTMHDLWVFVQGAANVTGTTNSCGSQSLGTSLATTNACFLSAWVPANYVWCFTNRSAGTGNASNPRWGQIYIP